jgi:hypothetical protein
VHPRASTVAGSRQRCALWHRKAYQFFRDLYNEDHLVVSIDRLGFIRPTVGLRVPGVEHPLDFPQWKSVKNWLHWDMNPYTGSTSTYAYQGNYPQNPYNKGFDRLKVQGIVALADASVSEGGLQAVPGFHKHIQAWGELHPEIR